MNVDPRSAWFRSVDKAILLVALVVAALAVYGTFSKESDVKVIVAQATEKVTQVGGHVDALAPPKDEGKAITAYNELDERLDKPGDASHPFRNFVFYSPKEWVLPRVQVRYVEGGSEQPVKVYDPIKETGLDNLTLAMMKLTVLDKNIVDVVADKDSNQLRMTAKRVGMTTIRLVGVEGSSISFPVETTAQEVVPQFYVEAPEKVNAKADRGYNTLMWRTNGNGSPVTIYKVYRSLPGGKQTWMFDAPALERETPDKLPALAAAAGPVAPAAQVAPAANAGAPAAEVDEGPANNNDIQAVIQDYAWDDLDVSPGVEYSYQLQAVGMNKDRAGKDEEKITDPTDPVKAVAISPFMLALGTGLIDSVNVEVAHWSNFIPSFKAFPVHRGERVGDLKEFDCGFMLVDFLPLPTDEKRPIPVTDANGRMAFVPMPVPAVASTAILIGNKGERTEITKDNTSSRTMKATYGRAVDELLKKFGSNPMPRTFPKIGETAKKGRNKVEMAIKNDGPGKMTVAMKKGSDKAWLDVPGFVTRTIFPDGGDWEIGAICHTNGADGPAETVYEVIKKKLGNGKSYQVTFTYQVEAAPAPTPKDEKNAEKDVAAPAK